MMKVRETYQRMLKQQSQTDDDLCDVDLLVFDDVVQRETSMRINYFARIEDYKQKACWSAYKPKLSNIQKCWMSEQ